MDALIYFSMLLPAALMILAGLIISTSKRDATITSHHFATNFNIKKYSGKIMALFITTGIMFSLSGLIMIKLSIPAGFILLAITLIVFLILFVRLHKRDK